MTSSIPLSLPETMVPPGLPAGVGDALTGDPVVTPDFAGLLDGPVAGATPAEIPAVPMSAADISPVDLPWIGIPAGVPAAPLASASVARRFTPAPGRVERAGETLPVSENEAVDQPVTPTRAEQEDAMAMLSALFPSLPATTPPPPMELVPALAGTAPLAAGMADAGSQAPAPEPQAGRFAPAAVARIDRTDPTDPTDRSVVAVGLAPFAAPEFPAPPAVVADHRDANPLHTAAPRVFWSDTPEIARSQIPLAAAAAPTPWSAAIASAAPGLAGAGPVESPAPTKPPAEIAATPAPDCTVVEASVMRPDGVRLARRTAAGAVGTPGPILGEEKTAGEVAAKVIPPAGEKGSAGKKVLSTSGQQLAENEPDDGTTVAKGRANMNALSPLTDAPAQRPGAEAKLAEAVSIPSGRSTTHEAAGLAAPRVLSTVLEVVEAQEASKLRPVPAVHLRMQVAGEMVGIKVELRDNTVQTRFTTVSPELREALTREWQAARTGTPEGAPRLLDPVFNSNPDRGGSASTGQDAASQQQQQARAWGFPWQQSASPSSRRSRPAAAPASTPAAVEAPDARLFSAVA